VICRIDPAKTVENVIYLARRLQEMKIDLKVTIIGNLDPYHHYYYRRLTKMVSDFNLENRVLFKLNINFEALTDILGRSGIIFHPKSGEHFGISIVEAMSAGLVPVVPSIGGPVEFVPTTNQYDSIEKAAEIMIKSLRIQDTERIKISNSVQKFSTNSYKINIKKMVSNLLDKSKTSVFE